MASRILDFLCTCVLTEAARDIKNGNVSRLPTLSDDELNEITYPTQIYQELSKKDTSVKSQ